MAFFGLKTYFKNFFLGYFCPPIKVVSKNWVKMASKLVFIGAGRICPPCHLGCIPEAASCRVNDWGFKFHKKFQEIKCKDVIVSTTETPETTLVPDNNDSNGGWKIVLAVVFVITSLSFGLGWSCR